MRKKKKHTPRKNVFWGDFFYLSGGQPKDIKMPTSDKVPLLNRY